MSVLEHQDEGVRSDGLARALKFEDELRSYREKNGIVRWGGDDILFCSLCRKNVGTVLCKELCVDSCREQDSPEEEGGTVVLGARGKSEGG